MLQIDGSYGEGGGQILRTSLSLAAITGQPIRIDRIRAKRAKPGLAIQHLTGVRAAATLCQAEITGDRVGSTQLEFIPGRAVQAGEYTFDVTETLGTGSAGAVTLILQTVLLPLALAKGESFVTLKGGTFVAWSPPASYIEQVYLPFLQQMGVLATVELAAWGWYPRGGGELNLQVSGNGAGVGSLKPLQLLERGALQQVKGLAIVTELPSHIPQRMASRAQTLLEQAQLKAQIQPRRERGVGPGAGVFLMAEYEHTRTGFGAVGKLGLPAEEVAAIATQELLAFHENGAPVDVHLADQLLLPAALASQPSQYRVAEVSTHLTTNAWVIEQFGLAKVAIDESTQLVTVTPCR
ncbi:MULTISPECIES: RNA 3'-terminal phosphate cyclase [unclassified Leptolyngbya]|uniref:RNA 3'-terminal phosphate cyclase n=1 Tax=unclassified Leptolyngbya TaxID=2650499 RepID=UPI00168632AA|nr:MULTISPECIES: RNA 3'-terminal phosphate cyclase [unclassified Leptolyngbya]MBD1912087.1 RNA 3'-phosphate cyclase [Leptolyngbya sp. FACHB-8]MBD2154978.1 RNA 3'-phosphate cyclase [Leptolyngbya sp. FACHB-16]